MTPANALAQVFGKGGPMAELSPMARRRRLEDYERALWTLPEVAETSDKVIELSTDHHYCAGVYCREYFLPAGFTVTGRVHKYPCFNIVLYGDILIAMGELDEAVRCKGGTFFVSDAGEKKALFAYEDSVFLTFHATEETDPEKMWAEFTFGTVDEYLDYTRALAGPQEDDE